MALSPTIAWEVRSSGSAGLGGGFNAAGSSAGTDYSQADSAILTFVDLVIGAANSVTSAAFPLASQYNRNVLHITGGVGFTPGFYEIIAVAGAVATLDRSPGTLAASGGSGTIGGALVAPQNLPAITVGTVWLKGAFLINSQWVPVAGSGDGNFVLYQGYGTTRGDNGLPTLTATGAMAPMITAANQVILRNLKIDGAANTADRGIDMGTSCYVENVWVTGCNLSGMRAQNPGTRIQRCKFTGNGAGAGAGVGLDVGTGSLARACEASGNKNGFSTSNGSGDFEYCVSHGNTGAGFYDFGTPGLRLRNCVADANAGDGLVLASTGGILSLAATNCLFTNNGGWGVNSAITDYTGVTTAATALFFQNNGFYNNTSGSYHQVPAGAADILLTATPYTNAAGGDYSLNGTTGGGAAAKGAGLPGGFGLLGTRTLGSTGFLDLGAVQGLAGAGSGSGLGDPASLRTLWRELTNERSLAVVPDSTIDLYLNGGLQALNRRVHYHLTDTATAITLIAGQQEYTLPTDTVLVAWVQWNGKEIAKADTDEWRRRDIDWRNAKAGAPLEWAHYKDTLIVYPAPDAAAVAAQPNLLFRYVSTPPDFTASGAEQIVLQDRRLVVYWGVSEWASAHPDSALATIRAEAFQQRFDQEAEAVRADYAARMVAR